MEEKYEIIPVPTRILTHHDNIVDAILIKSARATLFALPKALLPLRRTAQNAARILNRRFWQKLCAICSLPRAASAAGTACRHCLTLKAR